MTCEVLEITLSNEEDLCVRLVEMFVTENLHECSVEQFQCTLSSFPTPSIEAAKEALFEAVRNEMLLEAMIEAIDRKRAEGGSDGA